MIVKNKVMHADCIEGMKDLPSNSMDIVITSPPYNCGIKYDAYDDNRAWQDYLDWCGQWLSEIHRVLKSTGRVCINVLLEMGIDNNTKRVSPYAEFYRMFQEVGIKPWGSPIWVDSHRVKYTAWGSYMKPSAPYIYCPYEVVMVGYKDEWKRAGIESDISKEDFMMGCSGIWKLPTETNGLTPAAFHIELPVLCIELLSGINDWVLDPFAGSGTTGVACIRTDRRFVGFEIDPEYCRIANNRIEAERRGINIEDVVSGQRYLFEEVS